MPNHTLTYYAVVGLGEITRMCFYHSGKEFENELVNDDQFDIKQAEGAYPFSQVPVLQVDNSGYICQSGAIARYAAKINGLYPEDPLKALYVDEIYESVNAVISATGFCYDDDLSDEEKEKKKQAFLGREIIRLENLFKLRVSKDSPFIANNQFSLADIASYAVLKMRLVQDVGIAEEQLTAFAPTVYAYIDKLGKEDVMKNVALKSKTYLDSVAE